MKNKNKNIIYLVITSLLLICFAWLYITKINLQNMEDTSPNNGIGLSEFTTRLSELLNKSPLFKKSTTSAENGTSINNLTQELSDKLKNLDETKNWGTYKNEEYGFEFMYPENWQIDKDRSTTNEIVFDSGLVENRETVKINNSNKTLDEWKIDFKNEYNILSSEKLTIDKKPAYKLISSEFGQTFFITIHNNYLYTITTTGGFTKNNILSTFKFTDEGEIQGIKTQKINTLPSL